MAASRGKVLIIDDDPFFLKILSDAFMEGGFAVIQAADGVAGIKAYVEKTPDVVISDLIMPNLGGVSTCLEISRLAGDHDPIIILLTSMFKEAPHEHAAPEMGARVHIAKTTKPVDIVIIVEQLLDRKMFGVGG
ncbi:MAG: response regulator [Desulfuromonadales bacterium]|nr:MAG: response regulator [Desulfuromonadales bacterium]